MRADGRYGSTAVRRYGGTAVRRYVDVIRRLGQIVALTVFVTAVPPVRRTVLAQVTRTDTLRMRRPGDSTRTRADSLANDTTRVGRGRGTPKTPSRQFPAPDSIIEELLRRRGFKATRYGADSVRLLAEEKEIRLNGHGLITRDGSTLEADTIRYVETSCTLEAQGAPRLFDPSGVMVGEGMRYDACNHAGIVQNASTEMVQGGGTWFMHGDIAIDNQEDRIYGAHATVTSCDLVDPHYHFAVREVKWVSKRLMVSRPAVLYVADVPVAWLPFVFQDTRRGRRSGILAPQFGINDIVRFNPGYTRHVSNVGYYWAISDFADAQASLDWYAERFTSINGRLRYRWLNRFMAGGIAFQEMHENGGTTSRRVSWSHSQQFSLASSLTANLDYATSSRIISRNAVDPILAIGTIDSRLNYQRRFSFGQLNVGGSRTQSLDRPQVSATFPTVAFTPNPIALSHAITWSPGLSFTNSLQQSSGSAVAVAVGPGRFDSVRADSRATNINLSSPIRIGSWNISNSVTITDNWTNQRNTRVFTDPSDSTIKISRTSSESFQTGIDWSTGVGLPVLFQGTWNFQPSINMVNTASGPYALRNSYTGGRYVAQNKRFQFSASVSPTLFGLFPGFGPIARIRHAVSPSVSWAYAPAAAIPLDYALAIGNGVRPATLTQPARQSVSLGLSQNFEAKLRPRASPASAAAAAAAAASASARRAAGDSTDAAPPPDVPGGGPYSPSADAPDAATEPEGTKIKLLSLQSDAISYDFEQARLPGRTGWTTQTWGNTVSSDLIRGFSLRFAHDLWAGPVGYDTTRFSPLLTSMTFGFSLGANTLNLFRRILGLNARSIGPQRADTATSGPSPTNPGGQFTNAFQQGPLATQYTRVDRLSPARGGQPFQAQFNYSLQRSRSVGTAASTLPGTITTPTSTTANSMLSGSVQFSPTPHWTVSWQSSYNFTQHQFADHVVRLDRDLHDWRASFTFVKSPNGNFLFNFFLQLIDEPDLKFGYDQRNVK